MANGSRHPGGAPEKIVRFPQSSPEAGENVGAVALDLVYRAAQLIKSIEGQSQDTDSRARVLVQRALELAEARVQAAEAASESVINEADAKVRELESALRQTQAELAAATVQISAAEMRANAAEARASEAMNALARIEDAIRTQIFDSRRDLLRGMTAAA